VSIQDKLFIRKTARQKYAYKRKTMAELSSSQLSHFVNNFTYPNPTTSCPPKWPPTVETRPSGPTGACCSSQRSWPLPRDLRLSAPAAAHRLRDRHHDATVHHVAPQRRHDSQCTFHGALFAAFLAVAGASVRAPSWDLLAVQPSSLQKASPASASAAHSSAPPTPFSSPLLTLILPRACRRTFPACVRASLVISYGTYYYKQASIHDPFAMSLYNLTAAIVGAVAAVLCSHLCLAGAP
jgi:hypothetical protein